MIEKKISNGMNTNKHKENDCPMPEVKIARFVSIEACKSIFSENSTFVLRSPEHYRRLYETTEGANTKGDKDEGCARTADGRTSEYTCFVTTCWTKLTGNEPTCEEWNIFKKDEKNIVAIISTPNKVCNFLNKALETDNKHEKRRFPFYQVKHESVNYGNAPHIDQTNIHKIVPFTKDKKFVNEQEYRFIMEYSQYPHIIDSYIFSGGIDYMEKCFANPEMSKENKEALLRNIRIASAGYGDFTNKEMSEIIVNAEILFVK